MSDLLQNALALAGQGVPVFPCKPLLKVPATPNGFKDATSDEARVSEWWASNPEFNIGVPTGAIFDVIDVDGLEGANALEEWAEAQGPSTVRLLNGTVLTPSGGYHIYLRPTGAGNRAGMLPHVDYRGVGGYVLVPPSRTEKGSYRWL